MYTQIDCHTHTWILAGRRHIHGYSQGGDTYMDTRREETHTWILAGGIFCGEGETEDIYTYTQIDSHVHTCILMHIHVY